MADETSPQPPTPAAETPQADTDFLFRLQVGVTEFLLRYSKYGGYVLIVVLVGAAGYAGWSKWKNYREESEFGAIADVDFRMPKPEALSAYGLGPRDDKSDAARMANLEEGAKRFEAAAANAHGTAAVYGYLKAADAYDRAGKAAERLAALQKAANLKVGDAPGFAADSAYAGALADAGKADDAVAWYRGMTSRYTGFYHAQTLAELARRQVDAGKTDDAKATIAELKTAHPDEVELAASLEALLGSPAGS